MMITKRQFSVTIVIFVTLLLLFMGFQLGRQTMSTPELNKHIVGTAVSGKSSAFIPDFITLNESGMPEGLSRQDEWILYCGKENSEYAATVKEWSFYTRIPAAFSKELPAASSETLPDLLMIEPDFVPGQTERIAKLMDKGVDVIFLALPQFSYIQSDSSLRDLLGIHKVIQEEIKLKGIHLFKGFLLGGERIFEEDTNEDAEANQKKLQDLDLNVPWYSVRICTKTYMRGTLSDEDMSIADEKKYKNEDMPAIVWRNHYRNAEAYAVNGEYLKNRRAGMGMLQAMMYERKDFSVYPVINAQVFSVDCLPILTNENQTEVEKVYGRTVTKVQTDIILPMFITLSAKYEKKPSCFLSVKCNRDDPAQPQPDILKPYLSMIDEMDGELSLSANYRGTVSKNEELRSDLDYLTSEAPEYRITAVMSSSDKLSLLPDVLKTAGAQDIRTISTTDYNGSLPVVSYLNDTVTCQQTTSDLMRHTFTDELELLGVQTLLAYNNSYYNMSDAFYPATEEDEWQNSSREVFSNLTTYSNPFRAEDSLTVTESDARVRTYFNVQYQTARSGDVITVTSDCGSENESCHFILRTHNEKVDSVSGGKFKKIEENAYLISAEQEKMEIKLTSSLSTLVDMEGSNR